MWFFRWQGNVNVNFLVAGVQKAGTTTLDHYLRQHPEIGMARNKELHFFDDEEIFSRDRVNYRLLERQFHVKPGKRVYGETTPIYLFWEPCMGRIRTYNPGMRIIAILRDPAERAFSGWNMERNRGMEKEDFLYAITHEQERTGHPLSEKNRIYSYTSRGFYAGQIKRALAFFPEEQLMFIKFEEFISGPRSCLQDVFHFLGVDPGKFNFTPSKQNRAEYSRTMSSQERKYLRELYHDDICEVEQLLGWDCDDWKSNDN